MLRALVITLLMICTVAATLPVAEQAYWHKRPAAGQSQRRVRRSRAWWRRHRKLLRRRRAMAARRARLRALAAQGRASVAKNGPAQQAAAAHALLTPTLSPLALSAFSAQPSPITPTLAVADIPAPPPPAILAPAPPRKAVAPPWPSAWRTLSANAAGEMRFNVRAADGRNTGAVTWARIPTPVPAPNMPTRAKTISGVSFADLRRRVIDRMLAEGGWVINDLERELGGRRTFVVVAESANADGANVSWVFYFTEFNGQIYGLTTSTRTDTAAGPCRRRRTVRRHAQRTQHRRADRQHETLTNHHRRARACAQVFPAASSRPPFPTLDIWQPTKRISNNNSRSPIC